MQAAIPSFLAPRVRRLARSYWQHLLLALGCVFVLLLLGSSHWQASASLSALGELQRHGERVERLDSLLIQVVAAENAVRGYLLSGNRAHLEPYKRSLATVHETLEEIRRDLPRDFDNDSAFAELSGLVEIKLQSLDQAVKRGIAGEETRIQGKRYTDRIRERILALEARLAGEGRTSVAESTRHVLRNRWMIATLGVGALALMALLFLVLQRQIELRERLARMLHNENQRLDALVQERTAELSELASYLTNVREAEKARLARDLHDELGALLTAAKMESGWIARHLNGSTPTTCVEHLARMDQLLDNGIALKRRIIDDLCPPLLEMLGLTSALRALGEEFARDAEEQAVLELPESDAELAPDSALAIFRIAQEALTNVRKHARARRVGIALRITEAAVELEISDDGRGFQAGTARWRHHGLAGMKHRVQMCGGEFKVDSQPGAGTRIRARIPLAMAVPKNSQEGSACRT